MKRTPLRRSYTHECERCGATFHPDGRSSRYCSRACFNVARTLPRAVCPACGRERADRKHSGYTYCSRQCAATANVKPRKTCPMCQARPVPLGSKTCSAACGYELRKASVKERPCAGCGTAFRPYPSAVGRGNPKFCSRSCLNAERAKRPAFLRVACIQCGATFRRTAAAIARISVGPFCSRECRSKGLSGPASPVWRGTRRNYRGRGWLAIAESIRVRDGRRCRRCGKPESDEPRRLSVDHVIPYRMFESSEKANEPTNLVALCGSCHSKKSRAELRWLRGDVLEMWSYQIAVSQPWEAQP